MQKRFLLLGVCLFLIFGCATAKPVDTLTQASTIDVLLAGVYDGELALERLLEYGNFGIGTFDRLDGEMVVLDGQIYQIKADGHVYQPPLAMKTPFAAVSFFEPEKSFELPSELDFPGLQAALADYMAGPHLFYAIRIDGRFSLMRTRSVPAQEKPYPPLAQVTRNQPEFVMSGVEGTIAGFWCPAYVKGINVPGFHLHFLSADHRRGGHVLEFEMEEGKAAIDVLGRFVLIMPQTVDGVAAVDLSRDRSRELESVEK